MSERSPSRRSLLKGATAAALLTVPAITVASEADPLLDLVTAYRDECAWLNSTIGDIPDDAPMPVWDALNEGRIPVATSKEGAIAALRLAVEMCEDFSGVDAVPNLMQAALGFLEGATS
ncbi:twin-arginine translocation signal domain-containing protein [Xanthobacter versatilis]|uniref:twin-arginine translocation signal domain-containing protein n=1 Tax=Xanthobacter autotrophicus (strain ATCC BAA-1158 / Py2) TaxID=78245 RepID=UPI00372C8318